MSAEAGAAIDRAQKFLDDNYNYLSNDAKATALAHLAVAHAMSELVAVSTPEPDQKRGWRP